MGVYRVDLIANLARQLAFTPAEPRAAQVAAAEQLLHDVDPAKGYPLDFVVYRITGYQPPSPAGADGHADLLTGLALQHDLGLLIEQVSDSLDLHAAALAEPVLAINDVTDRFDVTSKTIQRWRRRGLPARRFTFPDGKRRVGFLLSSVERFIAGTRGEFDRGAVDPTTEVADAADLIRHATRLAVHGRCTVVELARRVGRRAGRSPLAVLHTLRKHDADHPDQAVLSRAAPPVDEATRARICRGAERGTTIAALGRRAGRPRSTVHAVLMQNRAEQLSARRVRYVDDPLYHGPDAANAVAAIVAAATDELPVDPPAEQCRVPRDLPPYLRDLYQTPLLSPARERALFLAFNFHKQQFADARRRLDPELASARDLAELERHLRAATAVKNEILQANLRLVVSVARRHLRPASRPSVVLMDLVSEGNLTLMRAVEGFDLHKGFRFSTYATLALMKGFARAVPALAGAGATSGHGQRTVSDAGQLAEMADGRDARDAELRLDRDHVHHLLDRLGHREQQVIRARFGLGSSPVTSVPATCEQVGRRLGMSKQRVRQIERTALAALRAAGR
jgi:RNA polymerase primary sigma factor